MASRWLGDTQQTTRASGPPGALGGGADVDISHLVQSASYDATNKKIVLTTDDGTTQDVPISTLSDHATQFVSVGADITNLQSTTNAQATTIASHASSIASQATTLTNHASSISSQATSISTLQADSTAHGNTLSTHATDIGTLQTTTTSHGNSLTSQASDIGTLQSTTASHASSLTSQSSDISNLQSTTTSHGTSLSNQASDISTLQTTSTTHGNTLTSHASSINTLTTAKNAQAINITNLQNDMSGTFKAAAITSNNLVFTKTDNTTTTPLALPSSGSGGGGSHVFAGIPPRDIVFTSGGWHTIGYYYHKVSSDETLSYARYELYQSSGANPVGTTYGISFELNSTNEIMLEVNEPTVGSGNPTSFKVNSVAKTSPHVIEVGDTIELVGSTSTITSRQPPTAMTSTSSGGYTSSASTNSGDSWKVFNITTTPSTDVWTSTNNLYNGSGNYTGSKNLASDTSISGSTQDGEWIKFDMPNPLKLKTYRLTRQDGVNVTRSPKQWYIYGYNSTSGGWVELDSQTRTSHIGEYISGNTDTGGTNFTIAANKQTDSYDSFGIVFTQNFGHHKIVVSELQFFTFVENSAVFTVPNEFKASANTSSRIPHDVKYNARLTLGSNYGHHYYNNTVSENRRMYYNDDDDTARGYVYNYPNLPFSGYVEEAGGPNGLRGTGGSQGTVYHSIALNTNYGGEHLFNNSITTGQWHGSSPTNDTEFVTFEFPTAKTISRYRAWYGNSYATHPYQMWLYGSNASGWNGTPPASLQLTGGTWQNTYTINRHSYTTTYARYDLSIGTQYNIDFEINAENNVELDVNNPTYGTANPSEFKINGTTRPNKDVVNVGDVIQLLNTGGTVVAQFTVPSALSPWTQLHNATTTSGWVQSTNAADIANGVNCKTFDIAAGSQGSYTHYKIRMQTRYQAIGSGDQHTNLHEIVLYSGSGTASVINSHVYSHPLETSCRDFYLTFKMKNFDPSDVNHPMQWDVGEQSIWIYVPENPSANASDWQSTSHPQYAYPKKGIQVKFEFQSSFGNNSGKVKRLSVGTFSGILLGETGSVGAAGGGVGVQEAEEYEWIIQVKGNKFFLSVAPGLASSPTVPWTLEFDAREVSGWNDNYPWPAWGSNSTPNLDLDYPGNIVFTSYHQNVEIFDLYCLADES